MNITPRTETRWALRARPGFLCGKYCWLDATPLEPKVRTYRTRREAREAASACCYAAKPIRVRLTIEVEGLKPTENRG